MEITKGKWMVFDAGDTIDINAEDPDGFTMIAELPKMYEYTKSNAKLIAEAGTVYNETGYSPRELADRKAELLGALQDLVRCAKADFNVNGAIHYAKEVIQKSTKQQLST